MNSIVVDVWIFCDRLRDFLIRLSAVALLLTGALRANASNTSATIAQILFCGDCNLVYVYPTGGVQSAAPCQGTNGSYYSFAMTHTMAKEFVAALLAAQARGATVLIVGTGDCRDQPNVSETIAYFTVVS